MEFEGLTDLSWGEAATHYELVARTSLLCGALKNKLRVALDAGLP